jgi:hypothetical protein
MLERTNWAAAAARKAGETETDELSLAPEIASTILLNSERNSEKVILPRRPGEPRFGPQPYYYPASRTGVVPRWASPTDRSAAAPAADIV